MTGATTTPSPKSALAAPCLLGGKLSIRMACEMGASPPPPRPWMMRMVSSMGKLTESPQSRDARVKTKMQASRKRLRWKRLPSQAVSGSTTALEIR